MEGEGLELVGIGSALDRWLSQGVRSCRCWERCQTHDDDGDGGGGGDSQMLYVAACFCFWCWCCSVCIVFLCGELWARVMNERDR